MSPRKHRFPRIAASSALVSFFSWGLIFLDSFRTGGTGGAGFVSASFVKAPPRGTVPTRIACYASEDGRNDDINGRNDDIVDGPCSCGDDVSAASADVVAPAMREAAEVSVGFDMPDTEGFYVRSARFKDLNAVANIFVDSFYDPKSMLKHYYRMLELDRIQNNFPYDSEWHEYYVACSSEDDSVIAFVDVDARKLPPHWGMSAPPRPYLSDLAVRDDWRRRGVATQMVVHCEDKARAMGYNRLFLRVEGDNDAALSMYARMGYKVQEHPYFGVKDTTTLLLGMLPEKSRLEEKVGSRDEDGNQAN
eukprot:CAMPEP_0113594608 /NCGR_PEP_ID=MMETSP0015_2-20120614/39177_1 /TAXON_ID=2838 /ORGANISM="Odontella" /LENGTH=305 /DNA_ID=CAMNT_0000501635 /DNA_START=266 /DNA_END=1181 /DNA_ORIENTATION=+ /assembly_acc=CAM_ASM_000160